MGLKKLVLLLLGGAALAYGEVTFSHPKLSNEDRILFQATAEGPGHREFRTLFLADIGKDTRKQLTFYPESLLYLPETGGLQIQNRFGLFRSDANQENMRPVPGFPSFLTGKKAENGKILPVLTSPNGRYILRVEPVSAAHGDLVLFDTLSGAGAPVSRRVELAMTGPEAVWSPNSRYFVYTKAGTIYYFAMEQYQDSRLVAESYRRLGEGGLSSLRWTPDGDLFYLSRNLVYRITGAELFARSLYHDTLPIGRVAGRLPFPFDVDFDTYWVAPDGGSLLLNAGGGHIFHCPLGDGTSRSLPYLYLSRGLRAADLLWDRNNLVTLLVRGTRNGAAVSDVYRIDLGSPTPRFLRTADSGITGMRLSPDGGKAALMTPSGIDVREYRTWASSAFIPHDRPLDAVWAGKDTLVVGGEHLVEAYTLGSPSPRFVCFSQPEGYGFQEGAAAVWSRNLRRLYDPVSDGWRIAPASSSESPPTANPRYRVYLQELPSGPLRNIPMVRGVKDPGTRPLFPHPAAAYSPLPAADDTVDFENFTHGSRTRGREIALTFDLAGSAEGLDVVLSVLADYNIRATFFVGGDFIRTDPEAARDLAASGHETASLFYTHFNMTDPRFGVTPDFIQRGLARNEDEYHAATGKELSLLWHAPYYAVQSDMLRAAAQVGYSHIGRDVDSLDWAAAERSPETSRLQRTAADLVERIMAKKKPGSIISFRIGAPEDTGPGDHLFRKLDLLINQLLSQGYRIVPVSTLKDNAK